MMPNFGSGLGSFSRQLNRTPNFVSICEGQVQKHVELTWYDPDMVHENVQTAAVSGQNQLNLHQNKVLMGTYIP